MTDQVTISRELAEFLYGSGLIQGYSFGEKRPDRKGEYWWRDELRLALAATAQDGWIPVSERLPEVPEGEDQEVIVCVQRGHNGERYSFSARYLNKYPLDNGYDDERMICTGWHDVKEHADYDGWYSPLEMAEDDEIICWMPTPPPPKEIK